MTCVDNVLVFIIVLEYIYSDSITDSSLALLRSSQHGLVLHAEVTAIARKHLACSIRRILRFITARDRTSDSSIQERGV